MVVRKGLGKNMSSVFSMKNVADVLEPSLTPETKNVLPINSLKPGKFQPRKDVPASGLEDLAQSIKQNGILNPIVVRKITADKGKFEILAGERRYQAAKLAGLKKVPVTILDVNDKQAMVVGLVENLQRKDLNALETAEGIQRLIDDFKYSHEGVAAAIGKSRPMISNLLRLLGLEPEIKEMLREGFIEMGHARALLSVPKEMRLKLAVKVKEEQLSVRQIEKLVASLKNKVEEDKKEETETMSPSNNQEFEEYEKEIAKILNADVKLVSNSKGKGKLQISFKNTKELEDFLDFIRIRQAV